MSFASAQLSQKPTSTIQVPGLSADRRKHRRVPVTLLGRFMRANKQEFPCRTRDISVGGISILAPVPLVMNEFIVAYFDSIGGVRGNVVRIYNDGFALKLSVTRHKQEKLAAELTWLINKAAFGTIEERRHERHAVQDQFSVLKLGDGFETKCQIIDISLSGASLTTAARPEIGTEVTLGKHTAIVRRHTENGIAIQFVDNKDQAELNQFES